MFPYFSSFGHEMVWYIFVEWSLAKMMIDAQLCLSALPSLSPKIVIFSFAYKYILLHRNFSDFLKTNPDRHINLSLTV